MNFFRVTYPICSKTAGLESLKESVGEWLPAVHADSRLAVRRRNCAITCRIVSLQQVPHMYRPHRSIVSLSGCHHHNQAGAVKARAGQCELGFFEGGRKQAELVQCHPGGS